MKDSYARKEIERLDKEIEEILESNMKQAALIIRIAEALQKSVHREDQG